MNKEAEWHNLYNHGWGKDIVPEAYSHPAKMAYGLVNRIYDHAFEQGWLKEGDVCADPFGGVGTTAIIGAYRNVQVVCCELEQKFVDLARENFKLHRRKWEGLDCPQPVIIQGDSREMCTVLGAADCVISSPPYADQSNRGGDQATAPGMKWTHGERTDRGKINRANDRGRDYGHTPGQLGSMKPGDVDAIVEADLILSSPPFQESCATGGFQLIAKYVKEGKFTGTSHGIGKKWSEMPQEYAPSKGNLGNLKPGDVDMVVSSPPFTGESQGVPSGIGSGGPIKRAEQKAAGYGAALEGYGQTPGNLGNLKPGDVDAIVKADLILSSPPFEDSLSGGEDFERKRATQPESTRYNRKSFRGMEGKYGNTDGNIGQDKGPTFWESAREIVQQCHQILKPGGHAIWVVKAFVRKGKRVDFPGDWRRLCESVGFTTVCTHHAMLVKETTEDGLFGEMTTKKERKSFFRRLAESKGSPAIDYEVILCMEKPA